MEKNVYGLDAENVMIGWKYPGAKSEDALVADVAASVLYNGSAGLIDLNINQQQKVLGAYGMSYGRPDAGEFILMGNPKQGQTLEEVRDILLAEVAKLRNGEFDETVLSGTINNMKKELMRSLEDNGSRADMFVQSFINGTDWADDVKSIERMQKVTKEDIMDWAGRYLGENNYAIVYKRMGEDRNVIKVTAPKITPIKSNRDKKSAFLEEITSTEVKPIEPSFIDYTTALEQFDVDGLNVLYVQNELNDLAELYYEFFTGTQDDPALRLASNYLSYLGTPTRSAEEIAQEMYQLACSFQLRSGS